MEILVGQMMSVSQIKCAGGGISCRRKTRNLTFKMIILRYTSLNKGYCGTPALLPDGQMGVLISYLISHRAWT